MSASLLLLLSRQFPFVIGAIVLHNEEAQERKKSKLLQSSRFFVCTVSKSDGIKSINLRVGSREFDALSFRGDRACGSHHADDCGHFLSADWKLKQAFHSTTIWHDFTENTSLPQRFFTSHTATRINCEPVPKTLCAPTYLSYSKLLAIGFFLVGAFALPHCGGGIHIDMIGEAVRHLNEMLSCI